MGLELVFFYGPPNAGKTLFYFKHFQATHQRVCPSAIFDTEPHITLRCLILKIVSILKKGQGVVLDDENEFKHTRASYINLIKNKVPDCKFLCIVFQVSSSDGRLQCNWAREWNIAQAFLSQGKRPNVNILEKEQKLCQWFEEQRIDIPSESEGFEVSAEKMGLCSDSPFKLEVPALIVHMEVFSPEKGVDELSSIEKLATIINTWISANNTGRVILLGNIQHSCSQATGSINEETWDSQQCSCFDLIRKIITQLALKVETPLYFALIDYSFLKYPFILPPQPGPIAWLQRLHTINITHKSSMYICKTEACIKMAQVAGLKTFKAKTVLNNPKVVTAVNCRATQPVPVCITESSVSYYGNIKQSIGLEIEPQGLGTRPMPHIPLLNKARVYCEQMEQPYILKEFAMGRSHGICFKNKEILEKYQECYEKSASPTNAVLCTPYKPVLSSESIDKNDSISAATLTSIQQDGDVMCDISELPQDAVKSQDKAAVSSHHRNENIPGLTLPCIYNLKTEDIEKHALSESRCKKGQGILHLVNNLTATPNTDENLLQISCTCRGSQEQNYDVTALLGNQGIKEAKCSCQDSASQTGQCKHVVAMLLKHIEQNQVPKIKKQTKRYKRKRGSSKKTSGFQNTVYVMSSQELLVTANQMLQKSYQDNRKITEEEEVHEGLCRQGKTSVETKYISSIASSQKRHKKELRLESTNQTSTKQHEPFIEQGLGSSSKGHPIEPSHQMDEKVPTDGSTLHEESKPQGKKYGKSILDEMF